MVVSDVGWGFETMSGLQGVVVLSGDLWSLLIVVWELLMGAYCLDQYPHFWNIAVCFYMECMVMGHCVNHQVFFGLLSLLGFSEMMVHFGPEKVSVSVRVVPSGDLGWL